MSSPAKDGWLMQDVRTCEGQDKPLYNVDVTSNVVGSILHRPSDFGAIAGVPGRAAILGERNLSSSSGSLYEYQGPIGYGTLPTVNKINTENVPSYTQRDPSLRQKRVYELEEKQWCQHSVNSVKGGIIAMMKVHTRFERCRCQLRCRHRLRRLHQL